MGACRVKFVVDRGQSLKYAEKMGMPSLPEPVAPPGAVALPEDELTDKQFEERGRRLAAQYHEGVRLVEGAQWALGDWCLLGARRPGRKGAGLYRRLAAITGVEGQTLRVWKSVAQRVPLLMRINKLSWTHHAEVAKLGSADDQRDLLARAEANGWSVRELARRVRQRRGVHKLPPGGDARTVLQRMFLMTPDRDALDAGPLPWLFGRTLFGRARRNAPMEVPQHCRLAIGARAVLQAPPTGWGTAGAGPRDAFYIFREPEGPPRPVVARLADILETEPVDSRHVLSPALCRGVLRRTAKVGLALPPLLEAALRVQAGGSTFDAAMMDATANPVVLKGAAIGRESGGPDWSTARDDGTMFTLSATERHAVAAPIVFNAQSEGDVRLGVSDTPGTLHGGHAPAVLLAPVAVRKLTPEECERLQGLPTGHTRIPWRGGDAPDGRRYKAVGNGMAVPVVSFIAKGIMLAEMRRARGNIGISRAERAAFDEGGIDSALPSLFSAMAGTLDTARRDEGFPYLSVCSGVGCASVALDKEGWEPVAFAETDRFASAVLKARWPDVPNLGDFTQITQLEGRLDLLIGGTPCTSFSVAGKRDGLKSPDGKLALAFAELAARLRPRWFVFENVDGLRHLDEGRAFGTILGRLADAGYGFAYRVLDAVHFGVPQRRERVFVVGSRDGWREATGVLFPDFLRADWRA